MYIRAGTGERFQAIQLALQGLEIVNQSILNALINRNGNGVKHKRWLVVACTLGGMFACMCITLIILAITNNEQVAIILLKFLGEGVDKLPNSY